MALRVLIYGGLALLAWLALGGWRASPQQELDALVASVNADAGSRGFYRQGGVNVGFFPGRGWVLTLHVGDEPKFGPARYFVLERKPSGLRGELWIGRGPKGVIVVQGERLQRYLRRSELDLSRLQQAYEAHFGGPG